MILDIRMAVAAEQNLEKFEDLGPGTIPFVTEANVSTHLGEEKSLKEVLILMIDRLRETMTTVDSCAKPQILMLTQDTLKVAALWK